MFDQQALLQLYDREQRIEIEFPDMEKHVGPHVVRFVRPLPGMSFVLYSRLEDATADEVIDEQVRFFAATQQPFEWKVYTHDRPTDLVERLAARGFVTEEPDAIMALDLEDAPAALLAPPESHLPPGAVVQAVTDAAGVEDIIAVMEPVWGGDFGWMRTRLVEHLALPGYLSPYVIAIDGRPAAAGWTYFNAGHFASMWGGSTLPAHRGKGLYTALLAARVQEARERGYRYLTIDAGAMSRPIVARHGFQVLTEATACEWRGAAPASLINLRADG